MYSHTITHWQSEKGRGESEFIRNQNREQRKNKLNGVREREKENTKKGGTRCTKERSERAASAFSFGILCSLSSAILPMNYGMAILTEISGFFYNKSMSYPHNHFSRTYDVSQIVIHMC